MKYRHEYKCHINYFDLLELRRKLRRVMTHDKHSGNDGGYTIRSLYFDNFWDKALSEKQNGVNNREKFRIRYYNNDISFMRLEKKAKTNGMCLKSSEMITPMQCRRILENRDFGILDSDGKLIREFNAKRKIQLLRPKNIVIYEREAFVYNIGNVRVTLDTNIRGSTDIQAFLNLDIPALQLWNNGILEVKWDEFLPQFVRDIVQLKGRSISSFSKYAATRFI